MMAENVNNIIAGVSPLHKLSRKPTTTQEATGDVHKKGVLKNLAKFTGKHLYQRPFFNKFF